MSDHTTGKYLVAVLLGLLTSLCSLSIRAEPANKHVLPPPDVDLIGEVRVVNANQEDTLLDIARRHGVGYDEIIKANPGLDRWVPGAGTPVVLPSRYILPNAPREGLVLNIAEMRLYYFPAPKAGEKPIVYTFPVSVGRMDWKTPMGRTTIVRKDKDPAWYPPASIKAEHAKEGDILPDVVPPGPDNPLGQHALRLGKPGYLIHGTNNPDGIGMRVTHGCIRMYPEDVEWLFGQVGVGTPVHIVNQPVKVGWLAGTLFLESHNPLEEDNLPPEATYNDAVSAISARLGNAAVDSDIVHIIVEQNSGLPVPISDTAPSVTDDPRMTSLVQ